MFPVRTRASVSQFYATEPFDPDTTRPPRPGETDGKDYYFVTREEFERMITDVEFIEHAQFSSNFYGTSFMTVQKVSDLKRRCILDIESEVSHRGFASFRRVQLS